MDKTPANIADTLEETMPQPSKFWDRHAKGYARRPVSDQAAYEQKLKLTQDYLEPDMQVLELGCGTGTTALIHAPRVKHITGVDISGGMLSIAQEKAVSAGIGNVTFQQSSIDDFDAPEASYDVVMGHSILHLLENKQAAIAKIKRLLKPGGVFVSSTVCLKGQLPLLRFLLPIGRFLGLLPMVRFFTPEELESDLTVAGFKIGHNWRPGGSKAVFIVAKKPVGAGSPAEMIGASG